MPKYTLRTHPNYSLTVDDRTYHDGDPITLSKHRAEEIASHSRWHRFEEVSSGEEVSAQTAENTAGATLTGSATTPKTT